MHAPPPVTVSVGRSRNLAVLLLVLGATALLLWISWVSQAGFRDWRVALHAVLVVLTAGVLGGYWLRQPTGTLTWDGEDWSWLAGRAGSGQLRYARIEVCVDWQNGQLLRFSQRDQVLWLWLDSSMAAERWEDLRRATVVGAARADRGRHQVIQP